MKVSIITVVLNRAYTIKQAIESVLKQDYNDIEYIIIDGVSNDGTVEIIQKYTPALILISEKDNGLYDAMNKGISLATGDIVGILNADDYFPSNKIISTIVSEFSFRKLDSVIGDVQFVKSDNDNRVIRKYSAKNWTPSKFAWGLMPPHPSFFVKKTLFSKYGLYKTDFKIAADYELLIRFLFTNKIKWKYLPIITTKMRLGGKSTSGISSVIVLNKEIFRACKENNIYTNYFMIYSKYLYKPLEFLFHG